MQITVNWFVEPAISILARASTRSTPARPRIDGIATKSSDEQFVALVSGAADAVVTAMLIVSFGVAEITPATTASVRFE